MNQVKGCKSSQVKFFPGAGRITNHCATARFGASQVTNLQVNYSNHIDLCTPLNRGVLGNRWHSGPKSIRKGGLNLTGEGGGRHTANSWGFELAQ